MKKFTISQLLILIIGVFTIVSAQKTVTLAIGEWAPFCSENLKHNGFIPHIVEEAFALEGVKVEWQFYPWNRAYLTSEKGTVDGTMPWTPRNERLKDHYSSAEPVCVERTVFFHRKDTDFDWNDWSDLDKYIIGTTYGYTYGEEFTKARRKGILKLDSAATDETNMKKLLRGRFDIFACDVDVGYDLLNSVFTPEEKSQITHHPKTVEKSDLHLLLSKVVDGNEEVIKLFDAGFSKLKTSGKYDEILKAAQRGEYKKD